MSRRSALVAAILIASGSALAEDWPQFQGPRRDNMSTETGLLKRWPQGGPRLLWRADGLGHGFTCAIVADGRIYLAGNIGTTTTITALDLAGARLWQTPTGPAFRKTYPGARGAPAVVGDRLFHMNGNGHMVCLNAVTGKQVWSLNIVDRFGARNVRWGLAESLLVDRGRVICTPGGEKVALAALDARTGETVWTCGGVGDKPAYTAPALVDHGGLRQIVTTMAKTVVGVEAETGRLLWTYPHEVPYDANVDTPLHHEGSLYLFGTWGRGATRLRLVVKDRECSAEEVWRSTELDNEHGGVLLLDGHLYGQCDGNHKLRRLACLDAETGKTMWTSHDLCGEKTATLTYADGLFYVVSDRGEVALVRPNPERLEIVSQFSLPRGGKGKPWARPVVSGGRLYLRHGDHLYAYDIRAGD